ncbi:MAG: hypothetical protein H6649_00855 [Caldilineae bacterium]|nr:hypothetical protein [Caldilineae bacterium]
MIHGQPGAAFRRFRGGVKAHVGNGATIPSGTSPRTLVHEFSDEFRWSRCAASARSCRHRISIIWWIASLICSPGLQSWTNASILLGRPRG